MKFLKKIILLSTLMTSLYANAGEMLIECESFQNKGGWVVDQQFMDLMGSPYLLAHGYGYTVKEASTEVTVEESGNYDVYVRTYNWTSPWFEGKGPGQFQLSFNGKRIRSVLGDKGHQWEWQRVGSVRLKKGQTRVGLHDLTGFDGRCDAIYLTTKKGKIPPSDRSELDAFRAKLLKLKEPETEQFDFVIIGGGMAGINVAIAAARLGMKVALVQNRPILGGNNSSDVRVHLGGRITIGRYEQLGNLLNEFAPRTGGNAQDADVYEDGKKLDAVGKETNITLFLNYHMNKVEMNGSKIDKVWAQNIETAEKIRLQAPLFSDCTGDASLGFLAGADYRMGREAKSDFFEERAPEKADNMTMGASMQWNTKLSPQKEKYPVFEYGMQFSDQTCEKVDMGEWNWETGMNKNQITEAEQIRDYGIFTVYSNWSFVKNRAKDREKFANRRLNWVGYILGKRESRRLMGDYILKESDLRLNLQHEDGTASTTWTIDLHYPDPQNTKSFPEQEFKSVARHTAIHPYPIPYRCFYSRNIDNLFMAGRNISVTHVALGTVRVMRTTSMMGEVVGMAASLCHKYDALPKDIYRYHLADLKALMTKGVGNANKPNGQNYNLGESLGEDTKK